MSRMCSCSALKRCGLTVAIALISGATIPPSVVLASAAACQRVQTPNVGSEQENLLVDVAATSPTNVWAVGSHDAGGLIEHWNGRAWKIQASPRLGFTPYAWLDGVAGTSARNAWAVGHYYTSDAFREYGLIEHWNGWAWNVQGRTKAGPRQLIEFDGVAATSATNAWAVGDDGEKTLIEHWNGKTWKVQTSANPGADNVLESVVATSARNAWAVGHYFDRRTGTQNILIEHWNGSTWKVQVSPNPRSSDNALHDVAATSPTSAWAVGEYGHKAFSRGSDEVPASAKPLILHWNGRAWKVQASPNPRSSMVTVLNGVAVTSPTNAWAVGANDTGGMIEHWNGRAWRLQTSPGQRFSHLSDVTATSPTNAWAVGSSDMNPVRETLALHCI